MIEQERLYINDKLIELATETSQFSRTLQVNDLVSLDNRQTNFTKNIKIPKTPKNVLNMDYLGVLGNNSNLPYQKNTVKYFVGNEAIIYNGWGVITSTDDFYNLTIYDGTIDLYKAIENTTLGDLNLSALTHSKNLTTVVDSFSSTTLPYKYILADYGGKAQYNSVVNGVTESTINIDYMIPSVKISYLWNQMFSKNNSTYSGSIFNTDDFKNLYLTYPKPIDSIGTPTPKFYQEYSNFDETSNAFTYSTLYWYRAGSSTINNLQAVTNDRHFKVAETGTYRIRFVGKVRPRKSSTAGTTIDICVGKNSENVSNPNSLVTYQKLLENIGGDFSTDYAFDKEMYLILNAGESICLFARATSGYLTTVAYGLNNSLWNFYIDKIEGGTPDFNTTLTQFKTKDFLNEILQRFGLTIYKDKYGNNYQFKTLAEILNYNNVVDYSDKFQEKMYESYLYGSYAQKNYFKYKYNIDNSNYNDGYILSNNINLADSKDIIKSIIYSPEKELTFELGYSTNNYKIWNKELNNNKELIYKPLDNRFYLIKSQNKILSSKRIGSETLLTVSTINNAPSENYVGLNFQDVVNNYYNNFSSILNNSKILRVNLKLNVSDITDFDFSKLYFFKQLGGYFIVNKINNYQLNRPTQVELIQVNLN